MLILYPATWLNLLVLPFYGGVLYKIMFSENRESFSSSSPFWRPLYFYFCVRLLLLDYSTIFNKSSECRYACSWFLKKIFQFFTIRYKVSCGSILYGLVLRYAPSVPCLRDFVKKDIEFCQIVFLNLLKRSCIIYSLY